MAVTTLDRSIAQEELRKFLQLASEIGPGLKMFSTFIDSEWHSLIENPAEYERFCADCGTRVWTHVPNVAPAIAVIEWISEYESRWGNLPPAWFADRSGVVDEGALQDYLDSHQVVASWDCGPSTGSVARVMTVTNDGHELASER